MTAKQVKVQVSLPKEYHKILKHIAIEEGVTLQDKVYDVIMDAINKRIDKDKGEKAE